MSEICNSAVPAAADVGAHRSAAAPHTAESSPVLERLRQLDLEVAAARPGDSERAVEKFVAAEIAWHGPGSSYHVPQDLVAGDAGASPKKETPAPGTTAAGTTTRN